MKKAEKKKVSSPKRKHVRTRAKLEFASGTSGSNLYMKPEPEEVPTRVVDLVERLHQQEGRQNEAEVEHAMANAQVNLLADEVRRTRFEIDGVALTFGFSDACPEDESMFNPIVCVEVREDQKSSGVRMATATIPLTGLADLVAWARSHGIE
jgi:hypothetical protein